MQRAGDRGNGRVDRKESWRGCLGTHWRKQNGRLRDKWSQDGDREVQAAGLGRKETKAWKCIRSWVAEHSRQAHGDLVSPAVLPGSLVMCTPEVPSFPGAPSLHLT